MLNAEPTTRRRQLNARHPLHLNDAVPGTVAPARQCNLLLVCKRRLHEHDDFTRIAHLIHQTAPDVHVRLVSDRSRNALRPDYWFRPTLAVSTEGLRRFRPMRGRLFHGRQLTKSQEYAALERIGVSVPRWTVLSEDTTPDLSGFGKYVVCKPDLGACGAEVKIKRKTRVRRGRIHTDYEGDSDLMVQEFIYTGPWPVCYRVSTFFGSVLGAWRVEADRNRRPLQGPEAFAGGPQDGGISIASSGRGCTFTLADDPEILALAQTAHAAFPDIPLLGVDIVREVPSGKLYVLEVNSCGRTWHFSSARGLSIQQSFGIDLKSQFDALNIAAAVLVEHTRRYAA
jgi:hypothetical protein